METIESLEQLGLSKKAANAYLAILKLQKDNAHQIAKEAGLERTTVYKILDELVEKGLVTKSFSGKRLTYLAGSPQVLKELLSRKGTVLQQLLPVLIALQGKKQAKPVVRYYENIEGIRRAVMNTLNCQEKIRRDFASVANIVEFLGQRFIDHEIEERVGRGIKDWSLRTIRGEFKGKDWLIDKSNQEILREVRYLPESFHFEPVIFIHDNIVTIISSKKESYALVIESQELSRALKILFDIAWQKAQKV